MKKVALLFIVLSNLILSRMTSEVEACSFKSYYKTGMDVYYQCFKVKESDLETFKILGGFGYAKDKKNIYYNGEKKKEADRKTFVGLNQLMLQKRRILDEEGNFLDSYAKDKNYVYYNGKVIKTADSKTFERYERQIKEKRNL